MRHHEASASIVAAFDGMLGIRASNAASFQVQDLNDRRVAERIGPEILALQECNKPQDQHFRVDGPFYFCNAYQGHAHKGEGPQGCLHLLPLTATAASWLPDWYAVEFNPEHRLHMVDMMLEHLLSALLTKENELVLSLLTKIVRLEHRVTEFDDSMDLYAGPRRGKKMLHPMEPTPKLMQFFDAKRNIIEYDECAVDQEDLADDHYEAKIEYQHSERTLAFEFDARPPLGIWGFDDERARVLPWINAEQLSFGLSGFVVRGVAVTNPDSLSAIDFAPYNEKRNRRQRPYPPKSA